MKSRRWPVSQRLQPVLPVSYLASHGQSSRDRPIWAADPTSLKDRVSYSFFLRYGLKLREGREKLKSRLDNLTSCGCSKLLHLQAPLG